MEILIRVVNGQLQIQTNIADKIAVVGVLEFAKQSVMSQANVPAVQPAPPGLVGALTNGTR